MRYKGLVMRESILVTNLRTRDRGHLDSPWSSGAAAPALADVVALGSTIDDGLVIGGGEPTLRRDFPDLVTHFGKQAIIATDGLALHAESTVHGLATRGLSTVRVPFHSARADAHDWLSGIPGSHVRLRRSIATLQSAGVAVHAEVTLSRPTVPYLEETVAMLLHHNVQHIRFRMLRRRGDADQDFVTTAPRLGLMEPSLDAAVRLALRHEAEVELQDLPHCAIPGFRELHIETPRWVTPSGISAPDIPEPPAGGCRTCTCLGAPADYVSTFGWTEFDGIQTDQPAAVSPVAHPQSGEPAVAPPPRSGRQPSTRVADAVRMSDHANVGGDPTAGRNAPEPTPLIAVRFPADEPTRSIRLRLVSAAQQGATTLQIAGAMDHPEALTLLRESLRLSFPRVVLTADLTGLESSPDNQLFHLRNLESIWTPDIDSSTDVAKRILATAKVEFHAIAKPESLPPVSLFAHPGTTASEFEDGHSWPQWTGNPVH